MANSDVQKLKELYSTIHKCSLCHGFPGGTIKPDEKKVEREVFDRILNSEVLVVGQSLAETQVRLSGIPYHHIDGKTSSGGSFIEKYFNTIGYTIKPSNEKIKLIYSTDIVKCFPGKKDNNSRDNIPIPEEINTCRQWLNQELDLLKPKAILLYGSVATESFYTYYLNQLFENLSDCLLKPQMFKGIHVFALPQSNSGFKNIRSIYDETFKQIKPCL